MATGTITVSLRGKRAAVPCIYVNDKAIVVHGTLLRTGKIKDEEWLQPHELGDPNEILSTLSQRNPPLDLFTFSQSIPHTEPKYPYPILWESFAVANTTDYDAWWISLPQTSRKNVRRASRRGVVVRIAQFNEELVKGILSIYNETPVRQGRRFWHYGKDFNTVWADNATYLDRSVFVAAYHNEHLIGFLKIVYLGEAASIMQILTYNKHRDKRPANALIAKAVQICHDAGISHLIYGRLVYGTNTRSPIIEFKLRNGFQELLVPRYYVPLTAKGRLALKLGLHLGLRHYIPSPITGALLAIRSKWHTIHTIRRRSHTA